jgi:hypothetical protein
MRKRNVVLMCCVMLGGCAPLRPSQALTAYSPAWSYVPDASRSPIAVYAAPNTAWEMSLECVPSEQVLQLVFVDSEITHDRHVDVHVAGVSFKGHEQLDPPDGFAVSRVAVPLREPILERYAAGAGAMILSAGVEKVVIAGAAAARHMVRDCLKLRH